MLKKGEAAIRIVILLLSIMIGSMPVLAKDSEKELGLSIETNQSEYIGDEIITETIKIQNITEENISDIKIQGSIPKGYQTDDEKCVSEQWSSSISEVKAGESSEVIVRFEKEIVESVQKPTIGWENTNNPSDINNPIDTNTSTDKKDTVSQKDTVKKESSVQTGDVSHVVVWGMIGAVSFTVIIVLVKKKKIFFLFMAVILVSSFIPYTKFSVKAAETNHVIQKTVEVSKKITVDSEEVILTARVTYCVTEKEGNLDLSYEGYTLKWEDQFEGSELNREDWNIELHDPGWVNNELQSYVDSTDNIYIEDGKLVLKPIKTVNEDGSVSYTSGRVNSQNKHDFKYGLFEARLKVPKGQGFLPAFWMMPTDENLYGQWPKCGEIDIMEVLGHETDTSYGTIHYGEPHSESQRSFTLENGDFSEEYHVFNVEWEPGKISWYVDGKRIHTENDWYSAREGQGEITYPAPFDQPFYMILNLAVGGTWPGDPDETTDIENAAFSIDYVKVYQKDSYDENVIKPEKEVLLRDPDAKGNYINNGDFAVKEDLTDDEDWKFLLTQDGDAEALIENNELYVTTVNAGKVDYSVQVVQPNLPMKKGATYKLCFDACADEARTMKVDVSAPDRSYKRYLADTTVELTKEKQTYTFEFTMEDKNDANGRLEFNLGAAGSTAGIKISNVSLIKTGEIEIEDKKGILADGNHVYNGAFQEGAGRLGYWDVKKNDGAEVSVTNENNIRRLKVIAPEGTSESNPIVISQSELAMSSGNTYAMSFAAEGEAGKTLKVTAAGQSFEAELTGVEQVYSYKFMVETDNANRELVFVIKEPGTFYLDNVQIVEDSLIKNGSFNAGFAGYEPYVDSSISSDVSYVVDSLNEDNAADFSIQNTGDAAWKIQLKQNNIELEEGQWYKLTLDAKSSIARKLMFAIQRDGSSDNDWTPYSGEKIVDLENDYQTYEIVFQMNRVTDLNAVLSISMGAVDGIQIIEKHRICIDNINLEKIEAPQVEETPEGENLLRNNDFSSGDEGWESAITPPGEAVAAFENNEAVYHITNVGNADWNVQLKQTSILLEKGKNYRVTFQAHSTEARTIKLAMLSPSYDWYGGADIVLEKDQVQEVTIDFTMEKETDQNVTMVVSMGVIEGVDTPISTICLSDFSLIKLSE